MSSSPMLDDKERVRQATDIVDLIGGYLPLRRQGSAYVAVCPWHDDHRPSLQVNPARQSWKCWVCDIGGDVFSFVMKRESTDFRETLKILAERAGIELTSRPSPKTVSGNPNDKPTLFAATQWASQQYHQCLLQTPEANACRDYLTERGITQQATSAFKIGFAPNHFTWLLDRAKSTNFSPEVLRAVGLVLKSERTSGWYDRFRGRVMFPILDTQDRAIAFGGRILPSLMEQDGHPAAKYVNSPETRLYSKSDNLFGLNLARSALAKDRHLVIVEGYTDVIGAWLAGLENVAAVCGTALGDRHIRLIRRFADRVTLVLDGDDAGRRRAAEILELFVASDVDLRILTLPEELDPCDFLQKYGAAEFRQRMQQAHDALEHKLLSATAGIDLLRDTHRANQALESMLLTIATAKKSSQPGKTRLREQQILTRLSRMFQLDLDSLRKRLAQIRISPSASAEIDSKRGTANIPQRERDLLQLVLADSNFLSQVVANLSAPQFVPGPGRQVFEILAERHQHGQAIDFERLMLEIEDPDLKHFLNLLDEELQLKRSLTEVQDQQQLETVLAAFDRAACENTQREVIHTLSNSQLDHKEETEMLEQLLQQTRERRGLSVPTDG